MSEIKRQVKFQFGGVERKCDVTLALVMPIEEATGLGILELAALLGSKRAKLAHIAAIIQAALDANGMKYTFADVLKGIERDGIFKAHAAALIIIERFFDVPESANKKKLKASAEPAHDETTSH